MTRALRSLAWLPALALLLACGRAQSPDASLVDGQRLFGEHCASCHSLSIDTVIVGPSLHAIGIRAAENPLGLEARAYLRRSIVMPQAELAPGFPDLMPVDFDRKLTAEQLDLIIEFLLAQR